MTEEDETESPHITRLPDPAALSSGEFNRSRRTRLKILDAGVAVLARTGYKKLSTTAVAEEAGITRAAMLYHFGSRAELIEAIIHHVTRRRIDMYLAAMQDLPHDGDFLEKAVDIAWDQLQTPEFTAYTELSLASRTDGELRALTAHGGKPRWRCSRASYRTASSSTSGATWFGSCLKASPSRTVCRSTATSGSVRCCAS